MSSAEPLLPAGIEGGTNDSRSYDLELASRAPAPVLRGYVQGFEGYVERSDAPLGRREFPGPRVVVILELGPPIAVGAAERPLPDADGQGSFVVGVRNGALLTAHHGYQEGLQINLTPMGAYALFGLPLHESGERIVPLTSVLDGGGASACGGPRLQRSGSSRAGSMSLCGAHPRRAAGGARP